MIASGLTGGFYKFCKGGLTAGIYKAENPVVVGLSAFL